MSNWLFGTPATGAAIGQPIFQSNHSNKPHEDRRKTLLDAAKQSLHGPTLAIPASNLPSSAAVTSSHGTTLADQLSQQRRPNRSTNRHTDLDKQDTNHVNQVVDTAKHVANYTGPHAVGSVHETRNHTNEVHDSVNTYTNQISHNENQSVNNKNDTSPPTETSNNWADRVSRVDGLAYDRQQRRNVHQQAVRVNSALSRQHRSEYRPADEIDIHESAHSSELHNSNSTNQSRPVSVPQSNVAGFAVSPHSSGRRIHMRETQQPTETVQRPYSATEMSSSLHSSFDAKRRSPDDSTTHKHRDTLDQYVDASLKRSLGHINTSDDTSPNQNVSPHHHLLDRSNELDKRLEAQQRYRLALEAQIAEHRQKDMQQKKLNDHNEQATMFQRHDSRQDKTRKQMEYADALTKQIQAVQNARKAQHRLDVRTEALTKSENYSTSNNSGIFPHPSDTKARATLREQYRRDLEAQIEEKRRREKLERQPDTQLGSTKQQNDAVGHISAASHRPTNMSKEQYRLELLEQIEQKKHQDKNSERKQGTGLQLPVNIPDKSQKIQKQEEYKRALDAQVSQKYDQNTYNESRISDSRQRDSDNEYKNNSSSHTYRIAPVGQRPPTEESARLRNQQAYREALEEQIRQKQESKPSNGRYTSNVNHARSSTPDNQNRDIFGSGIERKRHQEIIFARQMRQKEVEQRYQKWMEQHSPPKASNTNPPHKTDGIHSRNNTQKSDQLYSMQNVSDRQPFIHQSAMYQQGTIPTGNDTHAPSLQYQQAQMSIIPTNQQNLPYQRAIQQNTHTSTNLGVQSGTSFSNSIINPGTQQFTGQLQHPNNSHSPLYKSNPSFKQGYNGYPATVQNYPQIRQDGSNYPIQHQNHNSSTYGQSFTSFPSPTMPVPNSVPAPASISPHGAMSPPITMPHSIPVHANISPHGTMSAPMSMANSMPVHANISPHGNLNPNLYPNYNPSLNPNPNLNPNPTMSHPNTMGAQSGLSSSGPSNANFNSFQPQPHEEARQETYERHITDLHFGLTPEQQASKKQAQLQLQADLKAQMEAKEAARNSQKQHHEEDALKEEARVAKERAEIARKHEEEIIREQEAKAKIERDKAIQEENRKAAAEKRARQEAEKQKEEQEAALEANRLKQQQAELSQQFDAERQRERQIAEKQENNMVNNNIPSQYSQSTHYGVEQTRHVNGSDEHNTLAHWNVGLQQNSTVENRIPKNDSVINPSNSELMQPNIASTLAQWSNAQPTNQNVMSTTSWTDPTVQNSSVQTVGAKNRSYLFDPVTTQTNDNTSNETQSNTQANAIKTFIQNRYPEDDRPIHPAQNETQNYQISPNENINATQSSNLDMQHDIQRMSNVVAARQDLYPSPTTHEETRVASTYPNNAHTSKYSNNAHTTWNSNGQLYSFPNGQERHFMGQQELSTGQQEYLHVGRHNEFPTQQRSDQYNPHAQDDRIYTSATTYNQEKDTLSHIQTLQPETKPVSSAIIEPITINYPFKNNQDRSMNSSLYTNAYDETRDQAERKSKNVWPVTHNETMEASMYSLNEPLETSSHLLTTQGQGAMRYFLHPQEKTSLNASMLHSNQIGFVNEEESSNDHSLQADSDMLQWQNISSTQAKELSLSHIFSGNNNTSPLSKSISATQTDSMSPSTHTKINNTRPTTGYSSYSMLEAESELVEEIPFATFSTTQQNKSSLMDVQSNVIAPEKKNSSNHTEDNNEGIKNAQVIPCLPDALETPQENSQESSSESIDSSQSLHDKHMTLENLSNDNDTSFTGKEVTDSVKNNKSDSRGDTERPSPESIVSYQSRRSRKNEKNRNRSRKKYIKTPKEYVRSSSCSSSSSPESDTSMNNSRLSTSQSILDASQYKQNLRHDYSPVVSPSKSKRKNIKPTEDMVYPLSHVSSARTSFSSRLSPRSEITTDYAQVATDNQRRLAAIQALEENARNNVRNVHDTNESGSDEDMSASRDNMIDADDDDYWSESVIDQILEEFVSLAPGHQTHIRQDLGVNVGSSKNIGRFRQKHSRPVSRSNDVHNRVMQLNKEDKRLQKTNDSQKTHHKQNKFTPSSMHPSNVFQQTMNHGGNEESPSNNTKSNLSASKSPSQSLKYTNRNISPLQSPTTSLQLPRDGISNEEHSLYTIHSESAIRPNNTHAMSMTQAANLTIPSNANTISTTQQSHNHVPFGQPINVMQTPHDFMHPQSSSMASQLPFNHPSNGMASTMTPFIGTNPDMYRNLYGPNYPSAQSMWTGSVMPNAPYAMPNATIAMPSAPYTMPNAPYTMQPGPMAPGMYPQANPYMIHQRPMHPIEHSQLAFSEQGATMAPNASWRTAESPSDRPDMHRMEESRQDSGRQRQPISPERQMKKNVSDVFKSIRDNSITKSPTSPLSQKHNNFSSTLRTDSARARGYDIGLHARHHRHKLNRGLDKSYESLDDDRYEAPDLSRQGDTDWMVGHYQYD